MHCLARLRRHCLQMVIGPAYDGGYYLLASLVIAKELFQVSLPQEQLPYSSCNLEKYWRCRT